MSKSSSRTPRKQYDGSTKPSLLMIETLSKTTAAETQLNKIEKRAKYLLAEHNDLKKRASKTDDPKERRKYRVKDEAIVAEIEMLQKAKEATVNHLDELSASEADYEYPDLEW